MLGTWRPFYLFWFYVLTCNLLGDLLIPRWVNGSYFDHFFGERIRG